MRSLRIIFIAAAIVALFGGCEVKQTAPQASSLKLLAPVFLKGVLEPAVEQFLTENQIAVAIVYDNPDSIVSRIRKDGSFDLFFAVGAEPFKHMTKGKFLYEKRYACPFKLSLVVVGRSDGPVIAKPDDLISDRIKRVVVVDPKQGYEGRMAEYILKKRRLWNKLRNKLIFARSSDHLYSYMNTGEADAAVMFESSTYGRTGLVVAGRLERDIGNRLTVCGAVVATSKNTGAAQAFLDMFDSRQCEIYKRSGIYRNE